MVGIEVTVQGPVAVIELNEPERRNALAPSIRAGIRDALDAAAASGLRAAIITGRGASFSAGGDLRNRPADHEAGLTYLSGMLEWFERVESCPILTVAAVNGHAMGGGAELALACDMVVAADSAVFGFPETKLGLVAPFAAGRLAGRIPLAVAKELLLTGRVLTAEEAARHGLVNRVTSPEGLLPAAHELVELVVARSALGTRLTKELMNNHDLSTEAVARTCAPIFTDPDTLSRIAAFLQRSGPGSSRATQKEKP